MLNIVLLCISVCALIIAIIVNINTWLTRTEEDYDYIFRQLLLLFFCTAVIILDAWFFPVPVALLLRLAIATMGGAIFFFLSSISIVLDYRNRY